jgi:cysteine desulfurase
MPNTTPLYFDANATTPIHPDVLREMMPYLEAEYGNPSSVHGWGQRAKNGVDEARFRVASFWTVRRRDRIHLDGDGGRTI